MKKIDIELLSEAERRAVEARRAYQKAWRAANKERVQAYNARFWTKKGEQLSKQNV